MPATKLKLTNVGPFEDIEFTFDRQVNVFTGPNNTGKSTALWALGELLVFPFTIPDRLLRKPESKWVLNLASGQKEHESHGSFPIHPNELLSIYRTIGHTCFVPAQRYSSEFRSSGPSVTRGRGTQLDDEIAEMLSQSRPSVVEEMTPDSLRQYIRGEAHEQDPELAKRGALLLSAALLWSNQSLVQKMIDLDYDSLRLRRPEIRRVIDSMAAIASEITEGFPIEFLGIADDRRGLYPEVRTNSGNFPMNSLSQGTLSIIHCLSHLIFGYAEYYDFPDDLKEKPGILIIDEIDAHLHPSWQRRFIPALTRHFPNLQIFCSTHSPLMLAGLKEGQVHLLRQSLDGNVRVAANENDVIGWTADEILRHLLALDAPTDLGTVEHLQRLRALRQQEKLSSEDERELEKLRSLVGERLISAPMADEIARFAEQLKQATAAQRFQGSEEKRGREDWGARDSDG